MNRTYWFIISILKYIIKYLKSNILSTFVEGGVKRKKNQLKPWLDKSNNHVGKMKDNREATMLRATIFWIKFCLSILLSFASYFNLSVNINLFYFQFWIVTVAMLLPVNFYCSHTKANWCIYVNIYI